MSEVPDRFYGNKHSELKRKRLSVSDPDSIPNSSLRINYYFDFEDEDDEEAQCELENRLRDTLAIHEDSNSNCSTNSSNCSNVSSFSATSFSSTQPFKKIIRKKNHHKILITEEKMADALKDLQIELNKSIDQNISHQYNHDDIMDIHLDKKCEKKLKDKVKRNVIGFSDGDEEEEDEDEDNDDLNEASLIISDELKKTFKHFEREENELKTLLARLNQSSSSEDLKWRQMQIVPYVKVNQPISETLKENEDPDTDLKDKLDESGSMTIDESGSSSHSSNERFISDSKSYKVDEPNEIKSGKNFLKRFFFSLLLLLL